MLASAISPRQDLTAYLIVLRAAIEAHGAPEVLGQRQRRRLSGEPGAGDLRALGIQKTADRARPALAKLHRDRVQRSCGGWPTTTSPARRPGRTCSAVHERFVQNYNHQPHARPPAQRPKAGAAPRPCCRGSTGPWCDPAELDRLFRGVPRACSTAAAAVRFRHWRLYAERGLAGAAGRRLALRRDADDRVRGRGAGAVSGEPSRRTSGGSAT